MFSLSLLSYYGIQYIRPKKISFYFALLIASIFLWILLLVTVEKMNLLYAAATKTTITTTLTNHVEKHL